MAASTIGFTILVLILTVNGQGTCPKGFEAYGDWCYTLLHVQSSWAEAEQLCEAIGGDLAVIRDAAEQTFVGGMLDRLHDTIATGQVWIGGTDLIQEAVFVEPKTLEPLKYFNWAPGEPDNLGGQHCLGLFKNNHWLWDDNGCEVKSYPLCKRSLVHHHNWDCVFVSSSIKHLQND